MKTYWIIGGGKFGKRAADRLIAQNSDAAVTVVDINPVNLDRFENMPVHCACSHGVEFLLNHLKKPRDCDWIIPALGLHLAFEWIKKKLSKTYHIQPIEIPDQSTSFLPNRFKGPPGRFYAGNADFICPDNCPEPDHICTHTGKPRPRILYQTLENLKCEGLRSIVIQSRQLAPGVGGYPPQTLFDALSQIQQSDLPVLLSTACKCHAVLDAFSITSHLSE